MDMESEDLKQVCRTCLTKSNDMEYIFDIAGILMSCAQIQVEQDDGLPTTICSECVALAKKAYGFRLLCENSDIILRKGLQRHTIKAEKYDSDFADSDCFTYNKTMYDSKTKIFDDNEVNETIMCGKIYQNEIFETDEKKFFDTIKVESLTIDNASNDIKQIGHNQFETSDFQNEIKDEEFHDNDNQNATEVSSDATDGNKIISDEFDDNKDTSEASDDECTGKNSSPRYCCPFCTQMYLSRRNFDLHVQKHVNGVKCQFCSKIFQNLSKLRTHVNAHKQKGVHECSTCGKIFTLASSLNAHRRLHTGIKPYTCEFCNKSFTYWNELKSHKLNHTSEKSHLCSFCGNKFARSQTLRIHMDRIHPDPMNERPHACTVCDLKFKVRRDLTTHMMCHTDVRNCICQVCHKAFKNNKYLRQHEKIHTGVKPHVCPVCQRAFLQKHVLASHLQTHSK